MEKSKATNAFRVLIPVFVIAAIVSVVSSLLLMSEKKHVHDDKELIELKVGATLPDIELTSLDGKTKKFSDVQKKVTLINFWATWCGPCVEEMPSLNRLHRALKGDELEIIGVNMDEDPNAVLPAFLKKVPIDFPLFMDKDGLLADKLSIGGLPFSMVVGPKNEILLMELGEREWGNDVELFSRWLKGERGIK